jgi:prevent-host-death family protein
MCDKQEGNAREFDVCVKITSLKIVTPFVRSIMKTVTLTDLRRNLEAYLAEAQAGDIVITRYGKEVGRLIATADSSAQGASTSTEEATRPANSAASAA